MRVDEQIVVEASRQTVWDYVTDPKNYPVFFAGITRWEVEGRKRRGIGARYRMLMHVASADVGGLVEVVEYDEPRDMAWTGVLGIDQRGRWRLRERGPSRTVVMLRLSYASPGGLLGLIADRLSKPMVRGNLRATLQNVKRQIETEAAAVTAAAPRAAARRAKRASAPKARA
jgi:uncharacterized membrane protein